jgi:hypothetical protein
VNPRSPQPHIHCTYRSVLLNNNIYLDLIGEKIPANLRVMLQEHIEKVVTPPLSDEVVQEIFVVAKRFAESAEALSYEKAVP